MQAPDEPSILNLAVPCIREFNAVHIALTFISILSTRDLEAELGHQVPLAQSTRAVNGSFTKKGGKMQSEQDHSLNFFLFF